MKPFMRWNLRQDISLHENVAQAASRYNEIYGQMPNLCFINTNAIDDSLTGIANLVANIEHDGQAISIVIRAKYYVTSGQLMIGFDEPPDYAKDLIERMGRLQAAIGEK